MARMPRVEFAGALYHLLCRGDRREAIFLGDEDRETFLAALGGICQRNVWQMHAYVLMSNHYHLVVDVSRWCSRLDDLANQPQVSQASQRGQSACAEE